MKTLILLFFALVIVSKLYGQIPVADKDVSSIEGITAATLESISGAKGMKRDWARFRKLFWPTAQVNGIFHRGDSTILRVRSLDEFVLQAGTWYEDNGFKEVQLKS